MNKFIAAATAAAGLLSTSAIAATVAITPGQYSVTTEYTAVTALSPLCPTSTTSGTALVVGNFTTGYAGVIGAGKGINTIVTQPDTATPTGSVNAGGPGINTLTCTYGNLPTTISLTAPTAYSAGVNCSAFMSPNAVTYSITQGTSGSSTINTIIPKSTTITNNSFHITSSNVTLTVTSVNGSAVSIPVCTISTDSLFVRTGV